MNASDEAHFFARLNASDDLSTAGSPDGPSRSEREPSTVERMTLPIPLIDRSRAAWLNRFHETLAIDFTHRATRPYPQARGCRIRTTEQLIGPAAPLQRSTKSPSPMTTPTSWTRSRTHATTSARQREVVQVSERDGNQLVRVHKTAASYRSPRV